jgi:hypothetical protein
MRTTIKTILIAPALMFAVACGKDTSADSALNNDLSLAAQANSAARLDSISAAERTNGAAPAAAHTLRSDVAPAPAPVRRSTASAPARRSTSSGTARSSGTSSGTTVASEPRTVTKKNTKRDAAIGAAAGAVIGATTSRDKVKGGIIGGVAGGILGGVIGNNVDVQKKPAP